MTLAPGRYSSAVRRSRARRHIYAVLASTLEREVQRSGVSWITELEVEGISRHIIEAEAERIVALLRGKAVKREPQRCRGERER